MAIRTVNRIHQFDDDIVRMARAHNVALVFSHGGDWPYIEEPTADVVYLRLHSAPQIYARLRAENTGWMGTQKPPPGSGQRTERHATAHRSETRNQAPGCLRVYRNDQKAYAPRNACRLNEQL